jgi:hypothetical protein
MVRPLFSKGMRRTLNYLPPIPQRRTPATDTKRESFSLRFISAFFAVKFKIPLNPFFSKEDKGIDYKCIKPQKG